MNQGDAAAADRGDEGPVSFLKSAMAALKRRDVAAPALALLILLTFSNIVVLKNMPAKNVLPPLFLIAAFVRIAGLLVLAVGILRILTTSPRGRWMPDAGFWLYASTFAASVAAGGIAARIIGREDTLSLFVNSILVTVLLSPLIVWFVAIAVARPLAWRPGRWVRDFHVWLPPLLIWTLLLVTPMGVLHASIDRHLIAGAGDAFWPLALFDGVLSSVMAIVGLGLNAAAYRRVAQG